MAILKPDLDKHPLTKFAAMLLLVLALFLVVLTLKAAKEYNYIGIDPSVQNDTIVVHGTGFVFAVPDVANFTFTVTEDGKTVQAAQAMATAKANAALAVAKDAGINDKDIQTQGYNVYPQYSQENSPAIICSNSGYCPPPALKQTIIGYEVSETIQIKVRDTSKAGDLLTKVGSTGVSQISGLDFTIDDQTKLEADARANAINDAKEKANLLADQLGVRLVGVASFSENQGGYMPYFAKSMAADAGGTAAIAPIAAPVPTGQNKITSDVDITYRIR